MDTLSTNDVSPMQRYLTAPLKRRYHRHYHRRHRYGTFHLIADSILALGVLALVGANVYFAFWATPGLRRGITLSLASVPETVRSGDAVTFTVTYENRNTTALTDVRLAVLLPRTLRHVTTEPATFDLATHTFSLGTLEAGSNGTVQVRGELGGDVGVNQDFGAMLSYGSEGAKRRESKGMTFTVPVRESALQFSTDFPSDVVQDGTIPFVIHYQNRGNVSLENLVIRPSLGDTLRLVESTPVLSDGLFHLPTVSAGARGEVQGKFVAHARGEATLSFTFQAFSEDGKFLQYEEKKNAAIMYPKVRVAIIADTPLHLGGTAPVVFTYENGEDENILDFSLTVTPSVSLFISAPLAGVTISKQQNADLVLVRKGAKGEIRFTLQAREHIDRTVVFGDGDPIVHLPYTVSYRLQSTPNRVIRFDGVADLRLTTDFSIDAFGRYYTPEGDQIGRGSLPPRVDDSTHYWIFLPITNTISDVADVVVTAELGAEVAWTRKASVTLGDPVQYDATTRTLSWHLANVTKFTGGAYPDVGAALELALTPTAAMVGTEPTLLMNIHARGRDAFTNAVIERTTPSVTTALSVDRRVKGKTKVVR